MLFQIELKQVNLNMVQTVNARELHGFLNVGRDFSTWIKNRINEYGFVENQDFIIVQNLSSPKQGSSKARQQVMIEYHITLDMAKELSMLERNDQGRTARKYFIECEKMAKALPQDYPSALRALAEQHERLQQLQQERDIAIQTKAYISDKKTATAMNTASQTIKENKRLKLELGRSKDHATLRAVERATGKRFKYSPLVNWCKKNGITPLSISDELYGSVNSYPKSAWLEVYNIRLEQLF